MRVDFVGKTSKFMCSVFPMFFPQYQCAIFFMIITIVAISEVFDYGK